MLNLDTNLSPTQENIVNTLKNDSIGRNQGVFKFVDFLNHLKGSTSVSLDAQWGEGKTFFVKQCKLTIDCFNEKYHELSEEEKKTIRELYKKSGKKATEPSKTLCVYYDAWVNDNQHDPLVSLIAEITTQLKTEDLFENFESKIGFAKELINKISQNKFLSFITQADLSTLKKSYDLIEESLEIKEIKSKIHDFFTEILAEDYCRLIVFIDELDRCRPSFAVEMLERVKHYFDDSRVLFVFSVNSEQLQFAIKHFYGEGFNGHDYLDRFFDVRLAIPKADLDKHDRSLGLIDHRWVYYDQCRKISSYYNMSLRERNKYYNFAKIAGLYVTNDINRYGFGETQALEFSIMYIVPLVIGMRMKDPESYIVFIRGHNSAKMELIIEMNNNEHNFEVFLFNNDEKQIKDPSEKERIKREKLMDVYDALFNSISRQDIRIGDCEFSSELGNKILNISNIMSEFTPYE